MSDIRQVVIAALDRAAGIRANPVFAEALLARRDIALADLEIDSLARFEAMMVIEEALGIEIDDDELTGLPTLDALVAYLHRRMG